MIHDYEIGDWALDLLRRMEWGGWKYDRFGEGKPHCPQCGEFEECGHAYDCELALVLAHADRNGGDLV